MNLVDKKIVVTGGSGFLGSHVVDALGVRGAKKVVVSRSSEFDLRTIEGARNLFEDVPDVVIHCAARMGGIGANRAQPGLFFYENLMMGAHLIEQARIARVPKVVLIGTVCVYPENALVPFREDELWNGAPEETNGPYGHAKRMLIVQAQAYRKQYGMNAITLLPVNLYGPRDNFDLETSHVIPATIRKIDLAMREGRDTVEMWGDGSPTREFLYVKDAAEGIVLAAERYDGAEPVNIGSGDEISMSQLARFIGKIMGFRGGFRWDATRPNGQPCRRFDVSRARDRFGFVAKTTLMAGIENTIAWWQRDRRAV